MVFGEGIDKLGVRVAHCLKVSLIIDVMHSKANIILLCSYPSTISTHSPHFRYLIPIMSWHEHRMKSISLP